MSSGYLVGAMMVAVGCAVPSAPAAAPQEGPEVRVAAPQVGPSSATPSEAAPSSAAPEPHPTGPPPSHRSGEECNGSIDASLQHQLAVRAADVRVCYEQLLRREPQREGRLVVTVRLSGPGAIDGAWITLDELADPETVDCALASFKKPLNGTVDGDCAIVNVPLRFKIKKPEPPVSP